jgi:hypothetical protein
LFAALWQRAHDNAHTSTVKDVLQLRRAGAWLREQDTEG